MNPPGDRTPADAASDPDWTVLARVGQGDRAAFEDLYKRYHGFLYRFVYQTTRRTESVDDVINEVMYVVWRKAAQTEPRSRVSTWLLGIAYNKSLKSLARTGVRALETSLGDEDQAAYSDNAVGVREIEVNNLLEVALLQLSPEQRAVMEMVYYQGLHYSQIAQIMNCPENTVKTRIFHARRRLRALWPELTGSTAPPGPGER
ncbi:MAG: RNA polymerase sigma factor [Gammaproteobacteria bacterium]